jgi:hypothetical protein
MGGSWVGANIFSPSLMVYNGFRMCSAAYYSSLSRCSNLVNTTCLLVSSISPAKKTSSRIA